MGYEHRNGKMPDHVDQSGNNSDPTYGHQSDTTKVKADTASDVDVRKKLEKQQGPRHDYGDEGGPSIYRQRTVNLSKQAIDEGLMRNDPKSEKTYQKLKKSEDTDQNLNALTGPAKARADVKKAELDSASAMKRLKKNK